MEKSNCHAAWICALKTGGFFLFGYLVGRRFNLSCPFLSGSGSSCCDIPSLKKKVLTINEMPTSQSLIKRVQEEEPNLLEPKRNVDPTPVDVLGPFYVIGAPFRAKLCPIYATGRKLLICGTLRDSSGHFVPFTVIDFWQANPADENYDIYFPDSQPKEPVYHPRQDPSIIRGESGARSRQNNFRVRVLTDHVGRYEIETVIPPPYFDPDDVCDCKTSGCLCAWRCPHIHAYVQPLPQTNCEELITQLYFDGEKYNDTDKHFTHKTSMKLTQYSYASNSNGSTGNGNENQSSTEVVWFQGNFDIVLSKRA